MPDQEFSQQYGPWALVTGAAEGLGLAFANRIAASGIHVVLLDVQYDKAVAQAEKIANDYSVETRAISCDLSDRHFLPAILADAGLAQLDIGLLVCCAGIGAPGAFLDVPLATAHKTVQVNCLATMTLAHHFAPSMVKRGSGGVVIVASNSGYAGAPYISSYAASKAFDLSFGEALWYELAPQGVDVLAFSPQGTNTPGFRRGMPSVKEGDSHDALMLPEEAASIALSKLGSMASYRPDLPEQYSRDREVIIKTAGNFAASLVQQTD